MNVPMEPDFGQLDDPALISLREAMRGELGQLPVHSPDRAELAARYDRTTEEIDSRARASWSVKN